MPSLISGRIYIFDVESDPRAPQIHKVTRFKTSCSQEKMKGKRVNSHISLIFKVILLKLFGYGIQFSCG